MADIPKIACVVPTNRPERIDAFMNAWKPLFHKHAVLVIIVHDGDQLWCEEKWTIASKDDKDLPPDFVSLPKDCKDLFCRYTDACRNLGFALAAIRGADYILTLDDDVVPTVPYDASDDWHVQPDDANDRKQVDAAMRAQKYLGRAMDPIQAHLDVLKMSVPRHWMSTIHDCNEQVRGFPYSVRKQDPVRLSHGVWVGTPDFDGETQLRLEQGPGIPHMLPYYVGPIPQGVKFPLCGMNVMVHRDALPFFYFAPMGPDSGYPDLHRFADIFMGIALQSDFTSAGFASYTGASTVLHTRASDARKNMEQEKLGRKWLDELFGDDIVSDEMGRYLFMHNQKRAKYAQLIRSLQKGST